MVIKWKKHKNKPNKNSSWKKILEVIIKRKIEIFDKITQWKHRKRKDSYKRMEDQKTRYDLRDYWLNEL